jgi:hypothetical protein
MNKLVKFILNIILVLVIYFLVGAEFGYFDTIYCQPTDGESNNNVDSNKDNKDVKEKDKDNSYTISANVAKGVIKEVVQGAVEGISNVVPGVIGGMVGGSLGTAMINTSKGLPPVQKAIFGVTTAVAGAFGVGAATQVTRDVFKKETNNKEAESPVSVSNVSNNKAGNGDSGKDGFISSVLETEDELSPLQRILNSEILLGILILVHMGIILLIPLHKLYVSSVLTLISKFLSPNIVTKYEKFKEKIEKIGNRYLFFLIIINILFILFYVCIIIMANVELSSNIDYFIDVHLKIKKSIIILLFVKYKVIVNKNKIKIKQQKIKKIKMIMKLNRQMIRSINVIQQLMNQMINKFKLNTNIKTTQSFSLFSFVMSQLNINIDETASSLTRVSYGVFLLSLVGLLCFINVLGFMITYVLIQKGNYEIIKLSKIINYYQKGTLLYVAMEALLCLLILLVFLSFLILYNGIKH